MYAVSQIELEEMLRLKYALWLGNAHGLEETLLTHDRAKMHNADT